jgi:hypothetical protein
MGGFGSLAFGVPGDPARLKRELPHLSEVRLVLDTQTIWEGLIEDVGLELRGGDLGAQVTCFGEQRRLDRMSVRRIWSKRDLTLQPRPDATGQDGAFDVVEGILDDADPTKAGLKYNGNGGTTAIGGAAHRVYIAPSGLTLTRIMGTRDKAGSANLFQQIWSSADTGSSYTNELSDNANVSGLAFDFDLVANANLVLLQAVANAAVALAATDLCRYYNLRVLGTSLTEDAAGGFYGGTILRDLIALVPGLTIGVVEDGSEFTIQQLERTVRTAARSVVDEVAGYYTREWAVWEDGRFDWKSVNADEPQWIVPLGDLQEGTELTTTIDGLAETVCVLYTDAASGLEADLSEPASEHGNPQRNPFVKQGQDSHLLVSPGFPMTSTSADQLAGKLAAEQKHPLVHGRFVLPAMTMVRRAAGSPLPAFMIRGGENIVVPDLPKTDLFETGRDGETLFHIVATEASLETGEVTLEVEGYTRRTDVLLARLAAATRTLTGL